MVLLCDGVLDSHSNGLLASGEMAETSNFLLFVKSVGGHFHAAVAA